MSERERKREKRESEEERVRTIERKQECEGENKRDPQIEKDRVRNRDIDGELDREKGDPKRPGAPLLVMGG